MSKRARYDGPHPINVFAPEDTYLIDPIALDLQPGQLLPTETTNGNPVPASVRDDLLKRDDWSEVQDSSGPSTSKKEGDK